jgi:type I restriction enzyme S subunit
MSKRVPKRKFKGFKNEWEQCKLGDIISELKSGLSRQLDNADIGLPVVRANNINDGILDMNNDVKYWYKDDPQGADTSNYLIHKNDILINFINSEAKMGTATIVDTEPIRETIYTTNILKMKADDTISDNLFLLYLTMTNHYCDYIKLITKPAVNQASFTTVDYKNYSFMMPSLKEQKKIGVYLNTLDSLITFHQRKYDKLQALKKAYLYEMFPQEGESVPKRRFPEFSGEWRYIKFNDIVKRLSQVDNTKQLLGVEYEDIVSGRGRLCDDFHKKEILKSGIRFSEGDILYGKLRPYLMNFLLADFDGVAIGDFWVLRPNENVCSEWIYTLIQTDMFCEVANQSIGTKMPRADWSVVSNTYFHIPVSFEEQKRIGMFFMNIDAQINRVDNKINKLKALKQAYLAEMFV